VQVLWAEFGAGSGYQPLSALAECQQFSWNSSRFPGEGRLALNATIEQIWVALYFPASTPADAWAVDS
jgi:hypothetical protein